MRGLGEGKRGAGEGTGETLSFRNPESVCLTSLYFYARYYPDINTTRAKMER